MGRSKCLYALLHFLLKHPIRTLWLKEVVGLENVPVYGGAILASNHQSYLDFLIVPVSGCRLPFYVVGEVFFKIPVIGWILKKLGFIQINRRSHLHTDTIKAVLDCLSEGELIGIFPEGTRSLTGKLQKAYNGTAFIAHMSELPVVPVVVVGTFEAWPKGSRLPKIHKCTVKFGKPLLFSRGEYIADKSILNKTTKSIMTQVALLAGKEYPW